MFGRVPISRKNEACPDYGKKGDIYFDVYANHVRIYSVICNRLREEMKN